MKAGSALMGASRPGLPTSTLLTFGLENPLLWGLSCVCGMFTSIPAPAISSYWHVSPYGLTCYCRECHRGPQALKRTLGENSARGGRERILLGDSRGEEE